MAALRFVFLFFLLGALSVFPLFCNFVLKLHRDPNLFSGKFHKQRIMTSATE